MSTFLEIISRVPWRIIESASDIEESWQLFKDLFFSVVDMTIPRVKWKKYKLKHWFSHETIHSIRQKRHLYLHIKASSHPSPSLLSKYRVLSNNVRRLTRRDTKLYTDKVCQDCHKNPKKFWSWINSSKGKRAQIPPITVSGVQITAPVAKANEFNQYFHSVFTKEQIADLPSLRQSLKFDAPLLSTVEFSPQEVFDHLSSIDISKACGPDAIPGFLLKAGAEFICSPLSFLFTTSMRTASLPKDWVTANVVPVFKRDDRSVV